MNNIFIHIFIIKIYTALPYINVAEHIYNYFKEEAVSDSVEEAMKVLGPDYEEMEIRLVRIKFLCEIAN